METTFEIKNLGRRNGEMFGAINVRSAHLPLIKKINLQIKISNLKFYNINHCYNLIIREGKINVKTHFKSYTQNFPPNNRT